jgi:hypothetical protein
MPRNGFIGTSSALADKDREIAELKKRNLYLEKRLASIDNDEAIQNRLMQLKKEIAYVQQYLEIERGIQGGTGISKYAKGIDLSIEVKIRDHLPVSGRTSKPSKSMETAVYIYRYYLERAARQVRQLGIGPLRELDVESMMNVTTDTSYVFRQAEETAKVLARSLDEFSREKTMSITPPDLA